MDNRVLRDYGESSVDISDNKCKHGFLGKVLLTFKHNKCIKSVECWLCGQGKR